MLPRQLSVRNWIKDRDQLSDHGQLKPQQLHQRPLISGDKITLFQLPRVLITTRDAPVTLTEEPAMTECGQTVRSTGKSAAPHAPLFKTAKTLDRAQVPQALVSVLISSLDVPVTSTEEPAMTESGTTVISSGKSAAPHAPLFKTAKTLDWAQVPQALVSVLISSLDVPVTSTEEPAMTESGTTVISSGKSAAPHAPLSKTAKTLDRAQVPQALVSVLISSLDVLVTSTEEPAMTESGTTVISSGKSAAPHAPLSKTAKTLDRAQVPKALDRAQVPKALDKVLLSLLLLQALANVLISTWDVPVTSTEDHAMAEGGRMKKSSGKSAAPHAPLFKQAKTLDRAQVPQALDKVLLSPLLLQTLANVLITTRDVPVTLMEDHAMAKPGRLVKSTGKNAAPHAPLLK
jgi:hypothetical protein